MMFLELINDRTPQATPIRVDFEGNLKQRVAKALPSPSGRDFRLVIPLQEYDAMNLYHENELHALDGYRDPSKEAIFLLKLAGYLGVGEVEVRPRIY